MPDLKPVIWIGNTKKELKKFPEKVQDAIGFSLYYAQQGSKHQSTKPLKGFGGAGVLEIVSIHDGDTYRAIYTVRFVDAVFALHAFQKKSKKGIKTPKQDIDIIRQRLKEAEELHKRF